MLPWPPPSRSSSPSTVGTGNGRSQRPLADPSIPAGPGPPCASFLPSPPWLPCLVRVQDEDECPSARVDHARRGPRQPHRPKAQPASPSVQSCPPWAASRVASLGLRLASLAPAPASTSQGPPAQIQPRPNQQRLGPAPSAPTAWAKPARSSESIRSVRIRLTTLARLVHGFVLLPSGISEGNLGDFEDQECLNNPTEQDAGEAEDGGPEDSCYAK